MSRILRLAALLLTLFFLGGLFAACPSWSPSKTPGTCNPGRTWVPAKKDADGNWQAGYCKDQL